MEMSSASGQFEMAMKQAKEMMEKMPPEQQKMIVVKSAVAYRAAYLPIAARVIEMDTAGLCSANLSRFPYQYLPRPIFPLDPKDEIHDR